MNFYFIATIGHISSNYRLQTYGILYTDIYTQHRARIRSEGNMKCIVDGLGVEQQLHQSTSRRIKALQASYSYLKLFSRTQSSLCWRATSVLAGTGVLECIGVLECTDMLEDDGAGTVHEAPSSRLGSQHHPPAKLICVKLLLYMLITWPYEPSGLKQRACELLFTSEEGPVSAGILTSGCILVGHIRAYRNSRCR